MPNTNTRYSESLINSFLNWSDTFRYVAANRWKTFSVLEKILQEFHLHESQELSAIWTSKLNRLLEHDELYSWTTTAFKHMATEMIEMIYFWLFVKDQMNLLPAVLDTVLLFSLTMTWLRKRGNFSVLCMIRLSKETYFLLKFIQSWNEKDRKIWRLSHYSFFWIWSTKRPDTKSQTFPCTKSSIPLQVSFFISTVE